MVSHKRLEIWNVELTIRCSVPHRMSPGLPLEDEADSSRTSLVMVPMPCKLLQCLPRVKLICRNKECDYSAAYIVLKTSGELSGQGMTFSTYFFLYSTSRADNQPLDEEMRL
jgi:hypothetical protein